MTKLLVAAVALLGLSLSAGCIVQGQEDPGRFDAPRSTGDDGDDDDDGPSRSAKKPTATSTTNGGGTTTTSSLAIDTKSCDASGLPEVAYTSVAAGSLPAASGGTIADGSWVLQSAEAEGAAGTQLTDTRTGLIRFSGNRFAWKDGTSCIVGTFTTSGANLSFTVEDDDPTINGATATVGYTVEADGGFTLKRGADEAYHYVKQ